MAGILALKSEGIEKEFHPVSIHLEYLKSHT